METPDFFAGSYFAHSIDSQFEHKPLHSTNNNKNNNHITVDDLLDFSKEDEVMTDAFFDAIAGNSADSSSLAVVDSCNSSVSCGEGHFDGNLSYRSFTDAPFLTSELCVLHDDLAELEWLSNFVEESFSTDDDLQYLQFNPVTEDPSTTTTSTEDSSSGTVMSSGKFYNTTCSNSPPAFPCKSRSKRPRAAPCDWSSRLLLLPPATASSLDSNSSLKTTPCRRRESTDTSSARKCKHCGSETTPQWRTGPMGPKTVQCMWSKIQVGSVGA